MYAHVINAVNKFRREMSLHSLQDCFLDVRTNNSALFCIADFLLAIFLARKHI